MRDAALATLEIQTEALRVGLTLKDAVPENIQFLRGRPILIDTLSFEPAGAVWNAYYQFCRRFLAPLLLVAYHGPEFLRNLAAERDGISLPFASSLLPTRTWLKAGIALHLHMHARADRARARPKTQVPGPEGPGLQVSANRIGPEGPGLQTSAGLPPSSSQLSRQRALVDSLRRTIEGLHWRPPHTEWTQYEQDRPTYSPEAWAHREEIVARVLDDFEPAVVWDLGAALGSGTDDRRP